MSFLDQVEVEVTLVKKSNFQENNHFRGKLEIHRELEGTAFLETTIDSYDLFQ